MVSASGSSASCRAPREVGRLALYLIVSICYVGFWLGLAILASVIFRSMATSALAVLALWILLAFFLPLGAQLAADTLAPMPAAVTNEVGSRRRSGTSE